MVFVLVSLDEEDSLNREEEEDMTLTLTPCLDRAGTSTAKREFTASTDHRNRRLKSRRRAERLGLPRQAQN